jgi:UPF0755 protein
MIAKKIIIGLIVFIVVLAMMFIVGTNTKNENNFGAETFKIEKGEGVDEIAAHLVEQGFMAGKIWFKTYVALAGLKSKFMDGEYKLSTNMTIRELVKELIGQRTSNKEVDVTLIEGWTIAQAEEYLVKQGLIGTADLTEYSKYFNDKSYFFLIDRPKKADLEGYLYPDTYRVYAKTNVEEIVKKMLDNFDNKLDEDIKKEIKKQKKTIFEVVTLASIVEKEMFGYENRRVVADVFLKRLKVGMALQSDATVNYVTGKGLARPTSGDLKIDSLYNTYKYPGLPPGPIGNPSIEAIKAVVYPQKTNYWYFLTTPDNKIVFSKNYDEHLANKNKYY